MYPPIDVGGLEACWAQLTQRVGAETGQDDSALDMHPTVDHPPHREAGTGE